MDFRLDKHFTIQPSQNSFIISIIIIILVFGQAKLAGEFISILILTKHGTERGKTTILHKCNAVYKYCITPIFRVDEIFAIFANFDFARNFPPAEIISTPNGISRNFPPAKFCSREFFLHAKLKY